MRLLVLSFLGLTACGSKLAAATPATTPVTGQVTGYYAEAEFTTPTLGDEYWANFRKIMEQQCPPAYNRPFVWRGPTTGFGVIHSTYYRAGNVVVSFKRFLAPHAQGGPWEMEVVERVEYLRKEKRDDGTDYIESTTKDPTGKTLRHRFQPGRATKLDFISTDRSAATALAQQTLGLAETGKTTYLGFPAVQWASAKMQLERTELADDPAVPEELRHSVMQETRYGPKGEVTMATRTLVLKVGEIFDASILAAPTNVEEMPERK